MTIRTIKIPFVKGRVSLLGLGCMIGFLMMLVSSTFADDMRWEWEFQDSGVKTSIRGLCAVDERICWYGTGKGVVGRTVDGGRVWERLVVAGAEDLEFRDVEAFDANHCLAMSVGEGKASRIYQTVDGGRTWGIVFQNLAARGFFNGMAFWDKKNGILAGDPVDGKLVILRTSDGGNNWKAMTNTPAMAKGEHAFAASGSHLNVAAKGHVWVASGGRVARVFFSGDFGETWAVQETPMVAGEASTGIFSVAFQDSLNGIAVGGDYEKEEMGERNAMHTSNGGRAWTLLAANGGRSVFPFRSCVLFSQDSKVVMVTGPQGSNLSRDQGKTWSSFGKQGFHTLSSGGGLHATWAAGSDGRIARLR